MLGRLIKQQTEEFIKQKKKAYSDKGGWETIHRQ